ncbi:Zn-ribbon domain-containing OB-fold protein [Siccirubricoccus sp. G192]|uniref:Zn-ribbon domain-containing OB-fold protein n=1 Tax=Siccirubricoccus sp. G192 TaxID=2849651 RepID=UPI001C2BAE2E|nr:OB-fold domain-containing protein [Siccirubricoccus sp. G192]MBV1799913.1 OB-fold domain-containing protein [Siccirubricoccus sp. G192]
MAGKERAIPAPMTNPETEPFWAAAREGKFLLRGCTACGKTHWYPRAVCPFCFSERTEWREGSGRGTIYSLSVMKRAPEPYAIAYVTLEEGPTMMTNIVDCDLDSLAIGQKVTVAFKPTQNDGPPFPMFRPA